MQACNFAKSDTVKGLIYFVSPDYLGGYFLIKLTARLLESVRDLEKFFKKVQKKTSQNTSNFKF